MYFEGCLPIEEMARRGRETLAYGPLQAGRARRTRGPVARPHAVVQLRQEDARGTLWNLVGCQTKLRVGEQKRIFRMLPGLGRGRLRALRFDPSQHLRERAGPARRADLAAEGAPGVFLAGRWRASRATSSPRRSGSWSASIVAHAQQLGAPARRAARGDRPRRLAAASAERGRQAHFQPMNVNYGLFPPLSAGRTATDRSPGRAPSRSCPSARRTRSSRERCGPSRTFPRRAAAPPSYGASRPGRFFVHVSATSSAASSSTSSSTSPEGAAHELDPGRRVASGASRIERGPLAAHATEPTSRTCAS